MIFEKHKNILLGKEDEKGAAKVNIEACRGNWCMILRLRLNKKILNRNLLEDTRQTF